MYGKDRLGRVNPKVVEENSNNQRIHRRHDRRRLIRDQRAAKTTPGQQCLRHIPLFPGMDVVGIHEIFKVMERGDGQPQHQCYQHNHGEHATGLGPMFLEGEWNGLSHKVLSIILIQG